MLIVAFNDYADSFSEARTAKRLYLHGAWHGVLYISIYYIGIHGVWQW